VQAFSFDLPDTVFYCTKDSIRLQSNHPYTYYSADAGGFSYIAHGQDITLKTTRNNIYAAVYDPFESVRGNIIENNKLDKLSKNNTKKMDWVVNHPMILQSFKIKTNPTIAQTITIQIAHTTLTVVANFVEEVEVHCNIRMLQFTKINTIGDVYFTDINMTNAANYSLDNMINLDARFNQNIFMYDLKFEKKQDLCNGKLITFVKSDDCIITNTSSITPNNINVYPNPTTGMVYFDENFELIEVYDINGKMVQTFQNQNQINLAHVSNGVYIIKINNLHYTRVIIRN
jgi:hypothetical protein